MITTHQQVVFPREPRDAAFDRDVNNWVLMLCRSKSLCVYRCIMHLGK
jgi:hypothetical protein